MLKFIFAVVAAVMLTGGVLLAADSAPEQSNWVKFREGMKQAGSAAWEGTKNVAEKTGDYVSEKYDEAKDYVHEKQAEEEAKKQMEAQIAEEEARRQLEAQQGQTQ